MIVDSLRFKEDTSLGQQHEYLNGKPIGYKTVYIARAIAKSGPSVTIDFYLSPDDTQKIIDIVEVAVNKELVRCLK